MGRMGRMGYKPAKTGPGLQIPDDRVEERILTIRRQKVILDADLAGLYGVTTKQLNQQVKRNIDRFPSDFAFRITPEEKSQLVTECDRFRRLKHSTTCPLAFTEYGAIMAASVLNSPRAVQVSVYVVRAFARLRQMLSTHVELAHKLDELERRLDSHDEQLAVLLSAIRQLMASPDDDSRRIGFRSEVEP